MQAEKVMLVILDGWGCSQHQEGNALDNAQTPFFKSLVQNYPHTCLVAHGEEVGLPQEQMGNSEVGHLNIGAGRVVYQELTRINKAIKDGDFFQNEVLLKGIRDAKSKGKALHLMGLLSDGGVHSHIEHLFALLQLAKEEGLKEVYIHCFLDGRDVPPSSAKGYLVALEKKCQEIGLGKIATISGRYYAMDRDSRWDRVALAYKAMVMGEGKSAAMATAALEASYHERITDEFVKPTVILDPNGQPVGKIQAGDTVIFFNFRADRARQITRAFIEEDFKEFIRPTGYIPIEYICFTEYEESFHVPAAFPPQEMENTLGEVLSAHNLKQLRIAETEKYAHVTFFFNGGIEEPYPGEERILIPSPKVATYNLKPEMSGGEIADTMVAEIQKDKYQVIIANFANPDMVGHTGVYEAAVKAVEAVDGFLEKVITVALNTDFTILITADHGNVETMIDFEHHLPMTAHTTNKVPFILINKEAGNIELRKGGALKDIAPTILDLLHISKPQEMTGKSLLEN